jgi:hypothetical protein
LGLQLLEALSKVRIFNAEYYRDNILAAGIQFVSEPGGRQLVIDADNARPHTAQKCRAFCADNRLPLATHPPHSPDLAPSDFFLFGHVKSRLQGIVFQSEGELLGGITEVLDENPVETLQRVFEHWTESLEWVSQNNDDYDPDDKHPLVWFSPSAFRD